MEQSWWNHSFLADLWYALYWRNTLVLVGADMHVPRLVGVILAP